jgi:cell division protein FtsQ
MRRVRERAGAMDSGLLVSPGEIIARAAATVPDRAPEEPPTEAARVWTAPPSQDEAERTIVVPPARPMRKAKRRPKDMLRHAWYYGVRGGVAAALLAAVVALPVWLSRSGALDDAGRAASSAVAQWRSGGLGATARLQRLTVEGRNRTSREAVRAAIRVGRGSSLFAADPWEIKRRLEALPWVRSATVERRYPDAIRVRLVERTPVARYRDRDALVLVDETGEIIRVAAEKEHDNLVILAGDGAPAAARALLRLLEGDPSLARRVQSATRYGRRRWDLAFEGGAILRLPEGHERAALAKFGEFERQHSLLARGAVTYDMRLPDRLVIRGSRAATPAETPPPSEKPGAAKKPKKTG